MSLQADRTRDKLRERARRLREERATRTLLGVVEDAARDSDRLVRVETLPGREARFVDPVSPLPGPLGRRLAELGIERLYTHQVQALDLVRGGANVVVVTGTASGKTLCYNLPVLEGLLAKPEARALYLFPTKALAQDQLKSLTELGAVAARSEAGMGGLAFRAATYDGDTPGHLRRKVRDEAQIILTNPDMLHSGILPNHSRWADFLTRLDTIVLDELHVYRGVFGSNVANVLRRLLRVLRHYGARPRIVAASATIANPKELAERLTGLDFELIDEDGSPRGKKHFVLWNPERLTPDGMERRSTNIEARDLMVQLMDEGYQVISFVRARLGTEVLLRYCQEELEKRGGGLAARLRAYRGGYLPQERRQIEAALFSGELLGVVSTNALELGIDVGSLDAAILIGYPGTIASTWQQAGRAGRREAESVAVFMAHNLPIDQYLMRHPDYFFARNPEHAVVDAGNPHILLNHLKCAAYELPLDSRDGRIFGEYTEALRALLAEYGHIKTIRGRSYFSRTDYPAGEFGLRTMTSHNYTIVRGPRDAGDAGEGSTPRAERNRVIGTMDEASAFSQLHPEAVYMHDAETHIVDALDLDERVAYVHSADVDYYTQSVSDTQILINDTEREKTWNGAAVAFGNVSVTDTIVLFKKIKFGTRDSIGYGNVDLPPLVLHTTSCWLTPPSSAVQQVVRMGKTPAEGMLGLSNLLSEVVGLFVMCDRTDVGTTVDVKNTGVPAVFVYDKYPGGLGFAQKAYRRLPEILEACRVLASECDCEGGCPSCVGSPIPPFSRRDPDTDVKGKIPDKEATLVLLHALLALPPYIPKGGPPPEAPEGPSEPMAFDEPEDEAAGGGVDPEVVKALPREVEKKLRELLEEALSSRPRQTDGGLGPST